jgi:hypothetical protein
VIACAALLILPAIALFVVPRPRPMPRAPRPVATVAETVEAPEEPPAPRPSPRVVRPVATASVEPSAITGVVLDPDGHPMKGAFVGCDDRDTQFNTTSDDDGRFSLAAEANGCLAVATLAGFVASDRTPLAAGRSNTLRLNRGGSIEGEVVDERGAPVTSYLLGIESYLGPNLDSAPAGAVRTINDAAGAFTWENLVPGRYVLSASAEARPPVRSRAVDVEINRATRRVRIVLPRGARLTGRVLDAETKRPIAGAHVALDRIAVTGADASHPVTADDEGRYSLEGAPAGLFSLRIWREGYRTRVLPGLDARGAPTLAQDIELNPLTDGGPAGEDFAGIGAFLQPSPNGVTFSRLVPGGPAEQAGVHFGDLIKRIDGADASTMTVSEVMQLLRGAPGTRVSVQLERGGQRVDLTIERRALRL